MPADAVPGSTIPEDTEAEIQLRDGTWVWAQVIGQRKDRQGRWCVGLRWYASPSVGGREGGNLLDSRYIRGPHDPSVMRPGRWTAAIWSGVWRRQLPACGASPVEGHRQGGGKDRGADRDERDLPAGHTPGDDAVHPERRRHRAGPPGGGTG